MDDLCVHSKEQSKYITHLKLTFEKCQVYRIFLNPKKCKFTVCKGKILGYIVFEIDISTNANKIWVIAKLLRPPNAKEFQCFIGHRGQYCRIFYMYVIIAKQLYALLIVFECIYEFEEAIEKL